MSQARSFEFFRDQRDRPGVAIILGATGQDGTLLSRSLLSKGWAAVGVARNIPSVTSSDINSHKLFQLIEGTITDQCLLNDLFARVQPDAVFNVAGFTHVGNSWDAKSESREVNYAAVKKIVAALELARSESGKKTHYYHSSSSEIFGGATEKPQKEDTPLNPMTPYGEHKALAHSFLQEKRLSTELPITTGILYNHESPLRPASFVSRKISAGVAAIAAGLQESLVMGNIDSSRDWGYAGDYVEAIAQLVSTRSVGDFIIATGVEHSVRDFICEAFKYVGVARWEQHVKISEEFFREADPNMLLGDASKIQKALGWTPKTSFEELVRMMVAHDVGALN